MERTDNFVRILEKAGLRITAQRRSVCHYLATTKDHPSPSQVYAALSTQNPDISRATVYNTLRVLRDLGAIVEISVGTGHTHYDTDTSPHVNLVCLGCDRVMDHTGSLSMESIQAEVLAQTGFVPVAGKIEILGFCADCRQRRRAQIRLQAEGGHAT